MRTRFIKTAVFLLALLISIAMLGSGVYAWEKEQQALNDVLDEGDTTPEAIQVTLPTILKVVEGKNAPMEQFTFVLQGKDDAPMPMYASDNRYTVSRIGKGTVSLGSITFDKTGTYVYSVYEVESNDINWTYDNAEYTLTITIKEGDGVLSAASTIKKDGKVTNRIIFTNRYKKVDLEETITISGQKLWKHGANPKDKQPDHIIVTLYADGKLAQQKKVTESTNWAYSFTLPKYTASGSAIQYTVDEEPVVDYSKKINGYTITNTYIGTASTPSDTPPKPPDTPSTPPDTTPEIPKTGEDFDLMFWGIMTGTGFGGFLLMLLLLKKTPSYRGRRMAKVGKRLMTERR